MIKQYIKQALRMIGENKLLSVISILGTALAICMIMVIVILYVVNTASFKPGGKPWPHLLHNDRHEQWQG